MNIKDKKVLAWADKVRSRGNYAIISIDKQNKVLQQDEAVDENTTFLGEHDIVVRVRPGKRTAKDQIEDQIFSPNR